MSRQDKLQESLRVVLERVEGDDGPVGNPVGVFVNLHQRAGPVGGGSCREAGLEVLLQEEIGALVEEHHFEREQLTLALGDFEAVGVVVLLVSSERVGEFVHQLGHLVAIQQDGVRQLAIVKPKGAASFSSLGLGLVGTFGSGSGFGRLGFGGLHVSVSQGEEIGPRFSSSRERVGVSVRSRGASAVVRVVIVLLSVLSRSHVVGCR